MNSLITLILSAEVYAIPVVMISMSIWPVFGSVALCCIAVRISLTASSMSRRSTVSDNLILASASEILINDSSWRGVAVIVFLFRPIDLIFWYSCTKMFTVSSGMLGCTVLLA